MIAANCRIRYRATTFFVGLATAAWGQVVDYKNVIGSEPSPLIGGSASFRAVEAIPAGTSDQEPARAFAGGFFTQELRMGQLAPVRSANQQDGILVGFNLDPATDNWLVDWLLPVACETGDAVITEVVLGPSGNLLVGGSFQGRARFVRPPPLPQLELIDPNGGARPTSFLAVADPVRGTWVRATLLPNLSLRSMAIDEKGDIYLTGPGTLARRYSASFQPIWDIPAPLDTVSTEHIATGFDSRQPGVYIQGEFEAGPNGNRGVFVVRLDKLDGRQRWRTVINSANGEERAGGLGVGPLGGIRAAVSSNGLGLTVGGKELQDKPSTVSRHAHLLFLQAADGLLRNDRLLGAATANGNVMEARDLDVDFAGNTYVAVSFTGGFELKDVIQNGQEDAAVVVVDALGVPMRFVDSNGSSRAEGLTVAAADRELQVLVGGMQGSTPEFFGSVPLGLQQEERAYAAILQTEVTQRAWILTDNDPNRDLSRLISEINQTEGEIYRVIDRPAQNTRLISAYLTTEQLAEIKEVNVFEDLELQADGTVDPAGWALEALNDAHSRPWIGSYTYPETCRETYLYLIDSAVNDSLPYFGGNPNLTLNPSILVRGVGDPEFSTKFDHGTEMLSMIAGPDSGAAQGTPVTVYSYDIYPNGVNATISSLIEAITLANTHKNQNHLYDPAVFCIASSADAPSSPSDAALESAIDNTVGSSVFATVLLSAGNGAGQPTDYTPSDLASKKGVICVGAIDAATSQVASTRGPLGVELWAPGEFVSAVSELGTPTSVTGTSASTALAAGAALMYLSANPVLTPNQMENALVDTYSQAGNIVYVPGSGSDIPGIMTYNDWAIWYELAPHDGEAENFDGDVWTNEEEYIWGFNPLTPEYRPSLLSISHDHGTNIASFEFQLSCFLYQPSALTSPFVLRNGSTLIVERSNDLQTWVDCTNTVLPLTAEDHDGNSVTISFNVTVTTSPCFYRVGVQ
ncbi:MAG: hypothetical protein CMO40_06760 [Verrucomicrobiaceae bacterium]|nr:hypothetical protein [Verrucomicrobiaceae bacterium]